MFSKILALVFLGYNSLAAWAAFDLALIGPPGSGKGTIGSEISRQYGLPRISTGDLVRAEILANTKFGQEVKILSESGQLIADGTELASQLLLKLKQELSKPRYANGVILDGYPRTVWQAKELGSMLASMGRKINLAPVLNVPRNVLIERIEGRLVCNNCGLSFHRTLKPPVVAMKCDQCKGDLNQRKDDVRSTAEKRIDAYEKDSSDLIAYYRAQGVLKEIDGTLGLEKMLKELQTKIDPAGTLQRSYLERTISSYPGPRADVPRLYNIVEIYENAELFRGLTERMAELVMASGVDYIAAPEARGWGLAGAVAFLTGKPMISIRKHGKLPRNANLAKLEYNTAYSQDAIELIKKPDYLGKTALIIDDGNSTGGTALAVRELLNQAGIMAKGIVSAIKYHYKEALPEYQQWLNEGALEMSYYDLGQPALSPLDVGVATTSEVKVAAVKNAFEERFPGREIRIHAVKASSAIAEQPVTEAWGIKGAENRLTSAKKLLALQPKKIDYWVSIENYIEPSSREGFWLDRAVVIVEKIEPALKVLELSEVVYLPEQFAEQAKKNGALIGRLEESGYAVTSGDVISEHYSKNGINISSNDWHQHADFGGLSRSVILKAAILKAAEKLVNPCDAALLPLASK